MSIDLFDVKGKIALVTGSTHGLGMAMAKGLGLAGAAIFLSSKASNFVNGHVVYVDGGILATIGKPLNEN